MFAGAVAAPALVSLLIRYYLVTEAIKFATGTERKDWIKMSLDISEQIGNVAEARFRKEIADPTPFTWPPSAGDIALELVTAGSALIGAPGTAAEFAGYTFPGEAAKQRQRLEAEVKAGFPFTRERIKGAPKYVKRKLSKWNIQVKKATAEVKKKRNQFGAPGLLNPGSFPKIVKIVSNLKKGKKPKSKAAKQIEKILGKKW